MAEHDGHDGRFQGKQVLKPETVREMPQTAYSDVIRRPHYERRT